MPSISSEVRAGELDLTLCTEGNEPKNWPTTELWRGPLRWITSERYAPHRLDPLPVSLASPYCAWREAAVRTLERASINYRIAYTSATLAGTHAPVVAGLAVTVSAIDWVPAGLRTLPLGDRLPELPETAIFLLKGREARQPVADVLETHIAETFRAETRRPVAA